MECVSKGISNDSVHEDLLVYIIVHTSVQCCACSIPNVALVDVAGPATCA